MVCIFCAGGTKVTNSRPQKRSNSVWRRRECVDCGTIFTSTEGFDLSGSIVVATNQVLVDFSRDKLFVSVYESLRHRKSALEDATALTDTIINRLLATITEATLQRNLITKTACHVLDSFDAAAATQYRAFHPFW